MNALSGAEAVCRRQAELLAPLGVTADGDKLCFSDGGRYQVYRDRYNDLAIYRIFPGPYECIANCLLFERQALAYLAWTHEQAENTIVPAAAAFGADPPRESAVSVLEGDGEYLLYVTVDGRQRTMFCTNSRETAERMACVAAKRLRRFEALFQTLLKLEEATPGQKALLAARFCMGEPWKR